MGRKQELSRQEQRKLAALEQELFGTSRFREDDFVAEAQELPGRLPRGYEHANSSQEAQPLLIWEDRGRSGANVGSDSSDTDKDEQDEDGKADKVADDDDEGAADSLSKPQVLDERPEELPSKEREPVWKDLDEDQMQVDISVKSRLRKLRDDEMEGPMSGHEYSKRLKRQHLKLHPRTTWASLRKKRKPSDDRPETESEDLAADALFQGASNLLGHSAVLPAGTLQATRLRDANLHDPSSAAIQSLEFHPNGDLLLSAGLDRKLKFFQVDGMKNAKIQSIFLADLPVQQAAFVCRGSKVLAAGRRKYFYLYDLEASRSERISNLTNVSDRSLERFAVSPQQEQPLVAFLGNKGSISLVSLSSRQIVTQLKMSGSVKAATFSDDGNNLFATGSDGIISTWDMRTRQCLSSFVDEGALRSTSLASSPGRKLLAAGSDAGFVNIYTQSHASQAVAAIKTEPLTPATVRPVKSLTSLLTTVDLLNFSPDGQILAMASKLKKDALRLVHTNTMTVFQNWPTSRSPIHYVTSMAFSPGGGFFAIGNAKGRALLYRLHHYEIA